MDFGNRELAAWLEEAIKTLIATNPKRIALAARTENDETLTAYYLCNAEDKAMFANHIQADAFMDVLEANPDVLRDIIEGQGG